MASKDHEISQRRQCTLLQLSRSTLYYQPKGESAENLRFMEIIDKQFLDTPVVWVTPDGVAHTAAGSQVRPPSCAAADAPDAVGANLPRTQHQR